MPGYAEPFAGFSLQEQPVRQPLRAPRRAPGMAERLFQAGLMAAEALQRQGLTIDAETLHAENNQISRKQAVDLLGERRFEDELARRGIELRANATISPRQYAAAAMYMDMSVSAGHARKLKAAGVTDAEWRGWLRQPRFAAHLAALSEDSLQAAIPLARQRVFEGVDAGDKNFIDLALRMTGNNPDSDINVAAVLSTIFTILDEEIRDPALMTRLGARIGGMLQGGQGASLQRAMTSTPSSVPAPAPEVVLAPVSSYVNRAPESPDPPASPPTSPEESA